MKNKNGEVITKKLEDMTLEELYELDNDSLTIEELFDSAELIVKRHEERLLPAKY